MTHDYTERHFGHDLTFEVRDQGRVLDAMGWGHGIKKGDFLILENGDSTTRYKVSAISYFQDPCDMWSGTLQFSPRKQRTS